MQNDQQPSKISQETDSESQRREVFLKEQCLRKITSDEPGRVLRRSDPLRSDISDLLKVVFGFFSSPFYFSYE